MEDQRFALFHNLVESILSTPGETSSSLRTAIAQQAVELCDPLFQPQTAITPEVRTYMAKVATHAYQVTDQDIEQLRLGGYNDDAIFELTLSGALGAGMKCLSQSMIAIKEAKNAPEEH